MHLCLSIFVWASIHIPDILAPPSTTPTSSVSELFRLLSMRTLREGAEWMMLWIRQKSRKMVGIVYSVDGPGRTLCQINNQECGCFRIKKTHNSIERGTLASGGRCVS